MICIDILYIIDGFLDLTSRLHLRCSYNTGLPNLRIVVRTWLKTVRPFKNRPNFVGKTEKGINYYLGTLPKISNIAIEFCHYPGNVYHASIFRWYNAEHNLSGLFYSVPYTRYLVKRAANNGNIMYFLNSHNVSVCGYKYKLERCLYAAR